MSETTSQQSPAQAASAPESNVAAPTAGREQLDMLDQLLKPEVQQSLTVLVENLPKLTEMVTFLTKAYDFAQLVITDRVLLDDLTGGLKEFVKPIEGKVKEYASAAIEASDRAQADQATIGLFGLLRMLKDPQMQKMFHFVQAFMDVQSERQKQR